MASLEISEVKVFTSNYEGRSSVGYGMITFCDAITVKFTIIKSGKDGSLFIAWPQRQKQDNEYVPQITFSTLDVKKAIDDHILNEFKKRVGLDTGGKTSPKINVVINNDKQEEQKQDTPQEAEPQEESNVEESKGEEKRPSKMVRWG